MRAPFPNPTLIPAMASGLTSGITNGTFSSIRKAELLSTTIVPRSTAIGPNFLLMDPPALNRAMSTPLKLSSVNSSTTYSLSSNVKRRPAERLDASILMELYGKSRSERTERNSWPTAPVTPTTASVGAFSCRDIRILPGAAAYLGLGRVGRAAEKKWFWRKIESEAIDSVGV